MTKDIRANIRTIATSDTARAFAATAAGEVIKKVATPGKKPEQPDGRVIATGIGGFAAGAGAATLATTAVKRIGKLVGRRRRPLFADVPKKAARAVEVPKEAVDRFASGLRDQVGGSSKPSTTARRPAAKSSARKSTTSRPGASKSSASKPTASKSSGTGTRTRAKSSRGSNGSSAKTTRSANGSSAKATRSSNGSSSSRKSSASGTRSRAKSTRSSNGSSGRSRATASGRR